MAGKRQAFVAEKTGADLEHVGKYSFDPGVLPGNVENFTGVAQVPIGLAGPLTVRGEHAQGDFYVPLATTDGTLVASYNRGMRLLGECGGVKTTVVDDHMQRAPDFIFDDALAARQFGDWVDEHHVALVVDDQHPAGGCGDRGESQGGRRHTRSPPSTGRVRCSTSSIPTSRPRRCSGTTTTPTRSRA